MTENLSAAKVEAFGAEVLALVTHAGLALLLSVGHRTGLLDKLAELPPSTSHQIAEAAELEERYVRKFLSALACGRIVDYDGAKQTFFLPREHAAFLTRGAGPNNFAMMAQYIRLLASVENRLVACFREGGGIPYSAYAEFQALQAEESAMTLVTKLLDVVVPLVHELPHKLASGIDVLDVGCGQGQALCRMAAAFPRSRFVGIDISEEGVAAGRQRAEQDRLGNVSFERESVDTLSAGSHDCITAFDVIHDLPQPTRALRTIRDALRAGGVFLMVEPAGSSNLADNIDNPMSALLYTASTFHCTAVSLAEGGIGAGTMWGEENARRALIEAGFSEMEVRRLPDDPMHAYFIAR